MEWLLGRAGDFDLIWSQSMEPTWTKPIFVWVQNFPGWASGLIVVACSAFLIWEHRRGKSPEKKEEPKPVRLPEQRSFSITFTPQDFTQTVHHAGIVRTEERHYTIVVENNLMRLVDDVEVMLIGTQPNIFGLQTRMPFPLQRDTLLGSRTFLAGQIVRYRPFDWWCERMNCFFIFHPTPSESLRALETAPNAITLATLEQIEHLINTGLRIEFQVSGRGIANEYFAFRVFYRDVTVSFAGSPPYEIDRIVTD